MPASSGSGDEEESFAPPQEQQAEFAPPPADNLGDSGRQLIGRLSSGQRVRCRVVAKEADGYAVTILAGGTLAGFLPTGARLERGQEVYSNVTRVHRGRVWLSEEFTERTLIARSGTRKYKAKRAVDLFPPAPADETIWQSDHCQLDEIISRIQSSNLTGCLQASSLRRKSRASALLFQGRVVGAVYNRKYAPDILPTEQSLRLMLVEMELPGTTVTMYRLPEHVVVPMSSLFVGYPIHRKDTLDARGYLRFIQEWFAKKSQTACIVVTLPATISTCLGFIYRGKYTGAFYIEEQNLGQNEEFLERLVGTDAHATVEASILPPDVTSSRTPFGLELEDYRH